MHIHCISVYRNKLGGKHISYIVNMDFYLFMRSKN